jgi:hypothetical protein
VIQTQAHFLFPAAFVSLGGRALPFDLLEQRFDEEPSLTNRNIAELSVGIGSVLFDFLLLTYMTIDRLVDRPRGNRQRFFVKMRIDRLLAALSSVLTIDPPALFPDCAGLTIFERAVIGHVKAAPGPGLRGSGTSTASRSGRQRRCGSP